MKIKSSMITSTSSTPPPQTIQRPIPPARHPLFSSTHIQWTDGPLFPLNNTSFEQNWSLILDWSNRDPNTTIPQPIPTCPPRSSIPQSVILTNKTTTRNWPIFPIYHLPKKTLAPQAGIFPHHHSSLITASHLSIPRALGRGGTLGLIHQLTDVGVAEMRRLVALGCTFPSILARDGPGWAGDRRDPQSRLVAPAHPLPPTLSPDGLGTDISSSTARMAHCGYFRPGLNWGNWQRFGLARRLPLILLFLDPNAQLQVGTCPSAL